MTNTTNKERFLKFAECLVTPYLLEEEGAVIAALKELGAGYGVDMDAVETQLRKSNAGEVAAKLAQEDATSRAVRLVGEMGFHLCQLASCVYDESTGLDIVEPLGDALSFLIVVEHLENMGDDTARD